MSKLTSRWFPLGLGLTTCFLVNLVQLPTEPILMPIAKQIKVGLILLLPPLLLVAGYQIYLWLSGRTEGIGE